MGWKEAVERRGEEGGKEKRKEDEEERDGAWKEER